MLQLLNSHISKNKITYKKSFFLIAPLFVSCLLFGYFVAFDSKTNHLIILTNEGYLPTKTTIRVGDTVTFRSKTGVAFWPASSLHPTHLIYPEFDPKKPVLENDTWQFTFNNPGEWRFHDHITPTAVGVITVLDQNGNVVEENSCTSNENKQKCWEGEMLAALDEGGVNKAFDVFASMYESESGFAGACHGISHLIGEASFEQFSNKESFSLSTKMAFCGYGFFHGFMGTLLKQSGDIHLAREFCIYVDKKLKTEMPSALNACYHGIGHGAIEGSSPDAWGNASAIIKPGLDLCAKFSDDDFEKHLCGTGIFNGIALAFIDGEYGLVAHKNEVFTICEKLDSAIFKRGCYDQMNTLIHSLSGNDLRTALEILETITEREYYQNALMSMVSVFANVNMEQSEYDDIIKICTTLDTHSSASCVSGLVTGLVEYGPINQEHILGFNFCTSKILAEDERLNCFNSVIVNTSFIYSEAELVVVCDLVAKEVDIQKIPMCV